MFNLEKVIANWCRQMLAAGINPSTLEELENHLREEIQEQMKSGLDEQAAFEISVQRIGQPQSLKYEFRKIGGFVEKLGRDTAERTNRVLGLLWLVYCLGSFYHLTSGLMSSFYLPSFRVTPLFVFAWLMELIYLRGVVASVLLFGGVMRERRFILLLAILDAIGGVVVILCQPLQPLACVFSILGVVTLWLLWPRRQAKLAIG